MAVHSTGRRKLTYQDYVQIPDDLDRHEILDGVHYVTPPPVVYHQEIGLNLILRLGAFVREHKLGRILYPPLDVVLSPHDIAQPDMVFISNQRRQILTEPNIQGAPDLVIEILSPSTRRRDETLKRRRYEEGGVAEYWLVDPRRKAIRILRRLEGPGFSEPGELFAASDDTLTTPLLAGLEISVREMFEAQ
jgi:Uma2 family endonuclease